MSYQPKFSVIIPVHNKAPHIQRAISSVLAQSLEDMEVIVIDDASTDESLDKAKEFNDVRLKFMSRSTPGPGGYAARNAGISQASGKWIAFLDADDEWKEGHLARMWQMQAKFDDVAFLSCGWLNKGAGQSLSASSYYQANKCGLPHILSFEDLMVESIKGRNPIWTSVVCVKNRAQAKFMFPEGLAKRGGDIHAWITYIARCGKKMAWSPHIGAIYHRDSFNMVTRTAMPDFALHEKVVNDLKVILSKREYRLLKRHTNRRIYSAWRILKQNDMVGVAVPLNMYWKEDLVYCIRSTAVLMLPVSVLNIVHSLRGKSDG